VNGGIGSTVRADKSSSDDAVQAEMWSALSSGRSEWMV
jgi:hypothetical protein